jgi:hypothetical protein
LLLAFILRQSLSFGILCDGGRQTNGQISGLLWL